MSLLEGKNFSVSDSGKVLELFGLRAMDGDRLGIWVMDFALTEGTPPILVEAAAAPFKATLEKVIEDDKSAGKEHLIDHVLITGWSALRLWCEGVIRVEDLASAEEEEGRLEIKLLLAGKMRKVVITEEGYERYSCATIDSEGNVV